MKNKSIKILDYYDTNLTNKENKISNEFVYQMIRYTDKQIVEKMKNFESFNQKKISRNYTKRIPYMSIYI